MASRAKTLSDPDPFWYKDAVIYQLHVKSFFDSNNDGVGDFPGLIAKLDYLSELGVNAVWLLPFYPSPRRDDGYDIAEYKGVHPEYGNLRDVKRFIHEAHARKLRVITELVINHTSDRHPWFQRARHAKPGSAARNFYVWSNTDRAHAGTRIIFLDTEKSNWAWDDVAKAYYWHRFYSHQPDLNFDNPRVLEAALDVLHFWLDMGVDGLELDAVPYLIEREGTNNENLPETHAILKRIRAEVDTHYKGRMLLAEANQWPEDVQAYFGNGDECQMLFHFPLMPRMYMAIAQEDRFPITDILRQTPDIPKDCQWAIFLRNHDELTLEMVTDKERDYLWQFYAADSRARLNLGIRRRLAPLLERDRRRIELMNSLLLTMPGTPIIYYGDEIGMGDNLHLGDRDGVRTPMQWSSDRNGGFSRADPAALTLPAIMDPIYGYEAVNVEAQWRDVHSLLNWLRRLLAVRSRHKAFGRGSLRLLRPENRKVLAYLRECEGETILCVVNVSRAAQAVELELAEFAGRAPVEMLGGGVFPSIGHHAYVLTLPPFGFYWFLLGAPAESSSRSTMRPGAPLEYHTFVLRDGLKDVVKGPGRQVLERDILPDYVGHRTWFEGNGAAIDETEIVAAALLPGESEFAFVDVRVKSGTAMETYALPLGLAWDDTESEPPLALARVRNRARVGYLTDGLTRAKFAHAILGGLKDQMRLPFGVGEIQFTAWPGFEPLVFADADIEWPDDKQSNSSLIVKRQAVITLIRRAVAVHSEVEMIRVLTERGFSGIAPLLGEIRRVDAAGQQSPMAIVQRFVLNQGNGFRWTVERLKRILDEHAMPSGEGHRFQPYGNFAHRLGSRLGEMHTLLARPSDDQSFAPETADKASVTEWSERARGQIEAAFACLRSLPSPAESRREEAIARLGAAQEDILRRATQALAAGAGLPKTRLHGNLQLDQVLVAGGDVIFVDLGNDLSISLSERRAKSSPLRDVAGLLRSIDYAAWVAGYEYRAIEGSAGEERAGTLLAEFRQVAQEAFLRGYGEGRGVPLDEREAQFVAVFALEKAACELVREVSHRPDRIDAAILNFAAMARDVR